MNQQLFDNITTKKQNSRISELEHDRKLLKQALDKERAEDEKNEQKYLAKREQIKLMTSTLRSGQSRDMDMSTFSPMSKDYDFKTLSTQASPMLENGKVNPFIDKSDIFNHKRRLSKIEDRKEAIQNMYKTRGIMTYAQHSVVQKMGRDKYYTNKMLEKFSVIDRDLK